MGVFRIILTALSVSYLVIGSSFAGMKKNSLTIELGGAKPVSGHLSTPLISTGHILYGEIGYIGMIDKKSFLELKYLNLPTKVHNGTLTERNVYQKFLFYIGQHINLAQKVIISPAVGLNCILYSHRFTTNAGGRVTEYGCGGGMEIDANYRLGEAKGIVWSVFMDFNAAMSLVALKEELLTRETQVVKSYFENKSGIKMHLSGVKRYFHGDISFGIRNLLIPVSHATVDNGTHVSEANLIGDNLGNLGFFASIAFAYG